MDGPQEGNYHIQVCGSLPSSLPASCSGAAVCLVGGRGVGSGSHSDGSYGSASTGIFSMEEEHLKLSFSEGQDCKHSDGKASTNILFECDVDAGTGRPVAIPVS